MSAYFITLFLVFLFSYLAESFDNPSGVDGVALNKKKPIGTRGCLFLCAFVLIFVAGSRYYVGTDFGAYYRGIKIYGSRLEEAIKTFDEPGLPLIARIVGNFTDDGSWFIMICSLLTIGLYLITLYRNGTNYCMMSVLFMFLVWDGTFNGVRQYFASAILFFGHRYIYDKKIWKWAITVFIASCFHISAVVMFVLYFLLRNQVKVRNIILLAVCTYIISANYDKIFSFIGFLKDEEMVMNSYATKSVNVLRILVSCAPAILCLIIYINRDVSKEKTFYINALVIHGSAMISASNSTYLARIGIYTAPYVVVSLPKLLNLDNKAIEKILRVGVLALYFIFWYIELSKNSSTRNYQWIWTHR